AARDLARQSMAVWRALSKSAIIQARRCASRIVGRDTEALDEAGLVRAAVECVAESTVDGVTAPLFFALLGGPVGAIMYRAINTLDSTFGYKSERYLYFGWASARLDDLANWLPARLTAPLLVVAAALTGHSPRRTWRILRRDGRKHESPNAGLAEAAMAGALGIALGGIKCYGGEALQTPVLGDAIYPARAAHIPSANILMLLTLALFTGIGLALRFLVLWCNLFSLLK
ncbi:MAG TPA: cobalamin biosynthesis protein CobD, partial [Verrucomicrobia bacterium]|nr:cobalamin biosynthesis protein CobD [Verrucomicrobiota bacterium]